LLVAKVAAPAQILSTESIAAPHARWQDNPEAVGGSMAGSYEILDPRFSRLFNGTAQVEKALHRLPLGGRPGLFRRRALSGVVRHPQ
jgi:hypothetical protein